MTRSGVATAVTSFLLSGRLLSTGTVPSIHDYRVLPWHRSTTTHPRHWPEDVSRYWVEARRSIEGMNWTAAALMARSAVQLVARKHGAVGNNLRAEIDDLADKGLLPTGRMKSGNLRMRVRIRSPDQPALLKKTQKMSWNFSHS